MKFIHTADLHLGLTLKSASFSKSEVFKRRIQEIKHAFFDLCETFKHEAIDFMLLSGDLFDRADIKTSLVEEVFNTLNQVGKPVYITIGNHDTFLQNQSYDYLRRLENIYFFSNETYKHTFKDIDIYGINTNLFKEETLRTIVNELDQSKKNVLCLHGDVFNAKDDHYLVSKDKLKSLPFDYIALGHIHKHEFIAKHIAYSGNLEPFDFSETEEKGYILGDLNTNEFIFKKHAKRKFIVKKITLSPEDTLYTLKQKVFDSTTKSERDHDFIRIVLDGKINRQISLDEASLLTLTDDYYYLEFKNLTKYDLDLNALKKAYKDTIIEYLIDAYHEDPTDEESLIIALDALLDTEEGSR